MLLEFKADLELANKLHWDWTPLHTAVMADSPEVVGVLIAAGADVAVKDGAGRDARELADEYRKEKAADVLKRRNKKK